MRMHTPLEHTRRTSNSLTTLGWFRRCMTAISRASSLVGASTAAMGTGAGLVLPVLADSTCAGGAADAYAGAVAVPVGGCAGMTAVLKPAAKPVLRLAWREAAAGGVAAPALCLTAGGVAWPIWS